MNKELEDLIASMLDVGIGYQEARRMFGAAYLRRSLIRSKGIQGRAAKELGIHRNTFSRLVEEANIEYHGERHWRQHAAPRRKPLATSMGSDSGARSSDQQV
jgi:DNA-binding NtrC family response regulator